MTIAARPRVERSFLKACPLFQRLVIAAAEIAYRKELQQESKGNHCCSNKRRTKRGIKLAF